MMSFVKTAWAMHPWLTGLEVAGAVLLAIELVLLGHMVAGWAVGVVTRNPDAFQFTRFVFMTGEDAQFGFAFVLLLGVLPLGLLLALVGGIGWLRAPAAVDAFRQATYGGLGLVGFSVLLLLASAKLFRGGIIPH
jgi:hypothetical protein